VRYALSSLGGLFLCGRSGKFHHVSTTKGFASVGEQMIRKDGRDSIQVTFTYSLQVVSGDGRKVGAPASLSVTPKPQNAKDIEKVVSALLLSITSFMKPQRLNMGLFKQLTMPKTPHRLRRTLIKKLNIPGKLRTRNRRI